MYTFFNTHAQPRFAQSFVPLMGQNHWVPRPACSSAWRRSSSSPACPSMRVNIYDLHIVPGRLGGLQGEGKQEVVHPTLENGLTYRCNIDGIELTSEDILAVQQYIWGDTGSFLPKRPAQPLDKNSPLHILSDIAGQMAIKNIEDKTGLLASNQLREAVNQLDQDLIKDVHNLMNDYLHEGNTQNKAEIARTISDVCFWASWLVRGYLFEPKLHVGEGVDPASVMTEAVIPAPLSTILDASRAFLGRHQVEFVYYDYTLSAAQFSEGFDPGSIDYSNRKEIIAAVRSIKTPVGFNDREGGNPEHYFRHNHSLMELQMLQAFEGTDQVLSGDNDGWEKIITAAQNACAVFQTMLDGSPSQDYPKIRLPIAGAAGKNLGTVYFEKGPFYEETGDELYLEPDGTQTDIKGSYRKDEVGQTGANSSMYLFFDLLLGLNIERGAFRTDQFYLEQMKKTLLKEIKPTELDTKNPIRGMQLAFDLLTRPALHLKLLVEMAAKIKESGLLESEDVNVLLSRLALGVAVLEHRITHAIYVMKSIFAQQPSGGQSRETGTGGSNSANFLGAYIGLTQEKVDELIGQIEKNKALLSPEMYARFNECKDYAKTAKVYQQKFAQSGAEISQQENRLNNSSE